MLCPWITLWLEGGVQTLDVDFHCWEHSWNTPSAIQIDKGLVWGCFPSAWSCNSLPQCMVLQ